MMRVSTRLRPLLSPSQRGAVRGLAISDTLFGMAKSAVAGAVDKNKEKQWEVLLSSMTSGNKWTLREWRRIIDSQMNSWTMYVPGVGSSHEVKDLKSFKAMLDCLTEEELDDVNKVNALSRQRVAQSSNRSVDDVNRLIFAFKQSDILATWLTLKKSQGERLPMSEEELLELQGKDQRVKNIAKKM